MWPWSPVTVFLLPSKGGPPASSRVFPWKWAAAGKVGDGVLCTFSPRGRGRSGHLTGGDTEAGASGCPLPGRGQSRQPEWLEARQTE